MSTNEKILEQWSNQIAKIPKIRFKEAQELTIKMNLTSDEREKAEIREKLINGTLYLICEQIKKHFLFITGAQFDIEDIISEANNQWISIIDSGKILSVVSFRNLFNLDFHRILSNKLVPDKLPILEIFEISIKDMHILLWDFIKQKNNNENLTISTFSESLLHRPDYEKYFWKLTTEIPRNKFYRLYDLFNAIYQALPKNKKGKVKEMSQRHIYYNIRLLINFGYYNCSSSINDMISEDHINKIEQDFFYEQIVKLIMESKISFIKKDILIKNLGLNGEEPMKFEEIGKISKKSRQSVGDHKRAAIAKLKKILKLKLYVTNRRLLINLFLLLTKLKKML